MSQFPIPVTVLGGFLGTGKTTLLRNLLQTEQGSKIAVIETEISEAPIDGYLLGSESARIITLANGCDYFFHIVVENALFLLLERLDSGEIAFDRLVIECTGLADPVLVAQTFLADEKLCKRYALDGIVTLVDAANAERHLQEAVAQAQVGSADCLLVSKTDLIDAAGFEALSQRLQRLNQRAPIRVVEQGCVDQAELFGLRGFNLNAASNSALNLRAAPADKKANRITNLVLKIEQPLNIDKLSAFLDRLLEQHGNSLLRYKGMLAIAGEDRRVVLQGALKLYGLDWESKWRADEARESVVVFIGDNLPEEEIRVGFAKAVA